MLDGEDGALVADLNQLLLGIDPTLNLLGANANVTATINIGDLKTLVQDLLTAQYGESGVTFNLETGVVSIDLAAAVGGNLNDLPVNTELLSSPVINDILATVTGRISTIADQVVDRVRAALHDATVSIHAKVDLDVAQAPLVQQVCETVESVIQVPTQILTQVTIQVPVIDGVVAQVVNGVPVVNGIPIVGGQVGGLLGGILGGGHSVTWITQTVDRYVTQNVSTVVDELVCHNNVTALPALETSATIDISGTVDEFIDGVGVDASAKLKVLGLLNTELNLGRGHRRDRRHPVAGPVRRRRNGERPDRGAEPRARHAGRRRPARRRQRRGARAERPAVDPGERPGAERRDLHRDRRCASPRWAASAGARRTWAGRR